jgi:hypothetical protein
MRLTAAGKIVLFLLVVGFGIGAWRTITQGAGGGFQLPSLPGKPSNSGGSGASGGSSGSSGGEAPVARADNEIEFVITAAKKDWVQDQINRFNAEQGGKWKIIATPIPSREAMHAILDGKVKPVLWSPGSPIWPTRLAEAWPEKHGGASILDMTDPSAYRVYLKSPLVFLTTKQKAKFLRPLLSGSQGWRNLRALSLGQKRVPWGSFRFSHADPLTSSSGMLTLGLILLDYNQEGADPNRVANSNTFRTYIKELERGLVYDQAAQDGTTKLTKAFLADPGSYDLITAYESAALEAAPKNPNIAVIYPNPTAVSEHAVSLLNGDWVTPNQREGALAFMKFLGSRQALQDGLKYKFRPVQSGGGLSLAGELSRYAAQGFQSNFSEIDLPPYEALNNAAFRWRVDVVKKPPTDDEK